MCDALAQETSPARIDALFAAQAPRALALRRSTAAERRATLGRLLDALLARREAFVAAFAQDLRKPPVEVDLTELLPVADEIRHAHRHLKRWMRARRAAPTLTTLGTRARVLAQPRGRCLIIGPWNYPVSTLLGPLASAVAAGNTVVLKPSEFTPHVNAVIAQLVAEVFDPAEVALVEGGVETSQHLLSLPFDHVFFTGSPSVGKLVMAAAAKHLASVTLELGGKSPVIVDAGANLRHAAEHLMWGKLVNAGQTCVAPDHVYVHRSVEQRFVALCREVLAERFGADPAASPDLGRMVHARHGPLGRAHAAGPPARRRVDPDRGDLRPGAAGAALRAAGRGDRAHQRGAEAAGAVPVDARRRHRRARAQRDQLGQPVREPVPAAVRAREPAVRRRQQLRPRQCARLVRLPRVLARARGAARRAVVGAEAAVPAVHGGQGAAGADAAAAGAQGLR
jgi:hypothetical protein